MKGCKFDLFKLYFLSPHRTKLETKTLYCWYKCLLIYLKFHVEWKNYFNGILTPKYFIIVPLVISYFYILRLQFNMDIL